MIRFLLLVLVAVSSGLGTALSARVLSVVTTTDDLAAIAREVGGEKVNVGSLTRGRQDPHYIEVRPSDMIKVSRADLFVIVGLDLDLWALPVLDGARNEKVRAGSGGFVDASAGIRALEAPAGKVDRSMGDIHPRGNPHYWLDPSNGEQIARNILSGLERVSPADADFFRSNFERFRKKLNTEIERYKKISEPLKNLQVVTYHKTWSYFAAAFALQVVDYIEPRAGVPASPKHIQGLIGKIRSQKIRLLITEPYFDARLPQKIAKETDSNLVILAPSVGAVRGVHDYFSLFEYNLGELTKALNETK